jgi:hypothetical protein
MSSPPTPNQNESPLQAENDNQKPAADDAIGKMTKDEAGVTIE